MTFSRCNTIPTNVEPEYPGDLTLEPREGRGLGGGFSEFVIPLKNQQAQRVHLKIPGRNGT